MAYGDLITGDGQLEYNGMVFGDGVTTFIGEDGITGWEDLPGIDSGDTPNPSSHGDEPGDSLSQGRIITWSGAWRPPYGAADDGSMLRALRMATTIGNEQLPIVIRALGETLLAYGKVALRSLPQSHNYSVRAENLSVQWSCADPKRYSIEEHQQQILLPTPTSSGIVYPIVYPIDYGIEEAPPTAVVVNAMDAGAPARYVFSGFDLSTPILTNQSTGQVIGFNVDLVAADAFEIDTKAGTVLLNGVDRLYTRIPTSVPIKTFLLAAGENDLKLSATSWADGAGVNIFWRDATF